MKTFRLNNLWILLLCFSSAVVAQTQKLDKTYKTNPGVSVNIDAQHTNINIERWDRNEVAVEAYLKTETKDQEEVKKLLESWKLETSGNAFEINIKSGGGNRVGPDMKGPPMEALTNLPEIIDPVMKMVGPLLENLSQNPLPPEFYDNMGDMNFDYEAYRKDGDKYLEQWEKKIEKNFGEDFERSMKEWASNFEKDTLLWKKGFVIKMEDWGEEFEASMEEWGEKFGKDMEKWGETFGKDMEKWAEEIEKEVEAREGKVDRIIVLSDRDKSRAKKNITVKMPKNAQLNLNVRHGDVKLNGNTSNLKADISHSRFSANRIGGKNTDLSVSYTPVKVKQWDYGVISAAYVHDFVIDKATSIKLNSNSSDVIIKEITETAVLNGSFGNLEINALSPDFNNLDIVLENSDLKLNVPSGAFGFSYNGAQSKISYPESLKLKKTSSYDKELLNGYNKSRDTDSNISIKANFSKVLLN